MAGCGAWGRNHVRTFARLGALAAVCDADPQLAEKLAAEYNVLSRDIDAVLQAQDIDAVVLATPAATHADLAARALRAGKHVFVEKPLALHVDQAEVVLREAARANRVLMVGHLLQYHSAFRKLLEITRAGTLGRLQYIYSNRLNLGRIRREENALWSFAPHDISMILALAGEQPEHVDAVGAFYLHKRIADVTTTHLAFASGLHAHVFVSWLHPFKEQKLVVVGEHGMAVFDDGQPWRSKLLLFPHRIDWVDGLPRPQKAEPTEIPVDEQEPLQAECQHFLDCVAGNRRPLTDGAEGLAVLRVLQTAEAALSRGLEPESTPAAAQPAALAGAFVHETAVVDADVELGAGTKVWHFSHVLPHSKIGARCVIGQNCSIGPDVTLGDGCKLQNNVSIYKGVTLAEDVFCGPSCVFTNVLTPRAHVERKDDFAPTPVGRGATIGANATIVCGHSIGEFAMVGAGAVVTKDVPAYALVLGNPARQVGWVSAAGERLGDDMVCPRTGARYAVGADGKLAPLGDAAA